MKNDPEQWHNLTQDQLYDSKKRNSESGYQPMMLPIFAARRIDKTSPVIVR